MLRFVVLGATFGLGLGTVACGSDDDSQTSAAAGNGAAAAGGSGSGADGSGASAAGGPPGSGGDGAGGGTAGSGAGPTGTGIASEFPGDVGIENHPDVILADGFETYDEADDLYDKWDAVYQTNQIRFATEPANVLFGNQSLEFTVPQQQAELSNATDKVLTEERDELFLRYYSRFMPPYDVVGSSHNGSMISAHYFENGNATPGIPADGFNKFLVNLEHWRGEEATPSPGLLNVYVYHPDQRSQWGDHFFPSGTVLPFSNDPFDWGPTFVAHPDITQALDQWYCYEYRVKANTPGQKDGQITVWIDGVMVADFPNLRFREIDSLKIDRFGLSFHIGSNPNGETKKWYDNVVAATSYIGPVVPR